MSLGKKLDQAQALIEEVFKEAHDKGLAIIRGRGVNISEDELPVHMDYPVWLENDSSVVFDDQYMSALYEAADDIDRGKFEDAVNELVDAAEE